ncbi:hypothetical protein PYCCODRAFT_1478783 [Trametes coccinea BRFM310]|uniref:DUF302 domain-containing protein n=1 Tax=Trametes coccinea (strain BRFM310) TaxID=1353009 RepID=A0A1Y2IK40_TRAC3|nr:hypothetical protein PYCCODRAFT_1478783 [Trametes coccinea BRFM310]
MSKSVVEYTNRRITRHTTLPFDEVAARLETAVNKSAASAQLFTIVKRNAEGPKEEIEQKLKNLIDGHEFIYFAQVEHHALLRIVTDNPSLPRATVYTVGNPLLGQLLFRKDLWTGFNAPLKIYLVEDADGRGTTVTYDDPATNMPVPSSPGQVVDEEVKRIAVEIVSTKVERLVSLVV